MIPETQTAPYASGKAIVSVIRRYRDRDLPDPITQEGLEQIGVSPSMTGVTIVALKFLGLVDDGGYRMEAFERLKRATTDEYPAQLGEMIRKAYLPVFTVVDPAQDGDIAVADAFRRYEPSAQRDKMVRLFTALCAEAGITEPKQRRKSATLAAPKRPGPREARTRTREDVPRREAARPSEDGVDDSPTTDYRLISAIIQQLPRDGKWSKERRERWVEAMKSAVDLLIEIDASDAVEGGNR